MIDIDATDNHPTMIFFQCRETLYTVAVSREDTKVLGAARLPGEFNFERATAVWDAVGDYLRSQGAFPRI